MIIPFGKPFPAIDSTSLRDGVAAGLVNGYLNELDDYQIVPGHTLFATHSAAKSIDSLYETLSGVVLGVTNGTVFRLNSDGTFDAFTGDTVTSDTYCYWAEDGQHVYLAHGGKLARLDLTNLIVTLLNENTPSAVTHVVRSKGFLLTNGNDVIITSSPFELSQVFDNSGQINAVATLTDKPGWILMGASRTTTPGNAGRIYLSKDNGLSWTKVYTAAGNNFVLCLCYMSGGVVLAGTGNTTGRILRSTDYGETWSDLGQQGSSTLVNVISKIDTNIAIAGCGSAANLGEVYRTTNNGAGWANIATPTDFGKQVTSCIVWSTTVVTVGAVDNSDQSRVWRSTNAGATFTDMGMIAAASIPVDSVRVSASIGLLANYAHPVGAVYRSTDTGQTWATVGTIPNLDADAIPFAFVLTSTGDLLMGTAGNNVAAGGAQIWKSNDDGVTWNLVVELETNKEAIINSRSMAETHTAGQIIAAGRTLLSTSTTANAAKWQTGVGRNAPQGDIFYSEDAANNYENIDSWERFNAQSVPDAVSGVFENRTLVYAAGPRSIEINYSSSDPAFPWQVSDPPLPYGLGAANSWVNWDDLNTVMYLSCTDRIWEVVKFQGRVQQSISQVYSAILNDRTLITSPSTAKAWGMVMKGIPIYVLSFQTDNLTICYNLVKDHWFRWSYWDGASYGAALANAYCYSKTLKKHFVGDRRDNGKIFELVGNADDSGEMRFELTSGHVSAGSWAPKPVGRMLFKCKRGAASDSSEPTFSWAVRDNGNTNFSTARTVSLGLANDTEFFGFLNRCGMYQTRQHRIIYLGSKTDFIFSVADES